MSLFGGAVGLGLRHGNPAVRVAVAWTVGVALLVAAWTLSYRWMPEGAVGWSLASHLPLDALRERVSLTAGIFGWNLLIGGLAIVGASLFRIGGIPLSYVAPWAWFAIYGVALGTNSFAITTPGARLAPQLDVAWSHVGLRELSAYLFAAAALADRHVWSQRSWLDWRVSRVRSWGQLRLRRGEIALLAGALALLAWSAASEAAQIVTIRH